MSVIADGQSAIGIDNRFKLPICNRRLSTQIVDSRLQIIDESRFLRLIVPYCTPLPIYCGMVGTSRRAEYSVLLERVYAMPSSAARKGKSMTVLTTRTRR